MGFEFKRWYRENRKQLLEKRRERYHTDPEYRELRIRQSAESYRRKKEREGLSFDRRIVRSSSGREFHSIGRIAEEIGKSVQTVREYHAEGIIPPPLYYDSRGWRLYSDHQLVLLRDTFYRLKKKELRTIQEVQTVLRKEWTHGEKQGGRRNRRTHKRHENGTRAANE